jgi:ribosome silencing factor RsfS/YbeB/iojap
MGGLEELFAKILSRLGAKAFSEDGLIGLVSVFIAYLVLLLLIKFIRYAGDESGTWFRILGSTARTLPKQVKNETLHSAVCAVVLLIAAFSEWPHFMYVLLSVFICGSSAYIASKLYSRHRVPLTWVFGAIAILYNPVLPVKMARSDWAVINVLTAVAFIAFSIYLVWDSLFWRRAQGPRYTAEVVRAASAICEAMNGQDTRILELAPNDSSLSAFLVVTSAADHRTVRAIADEIESRLKDDFGASATVEGSNRDWILLDYVDFIVHIFLAGKRAFYDIERLRKPANSFSPSEFEKAMRLPKSHPG